jgi:hypothetical protein
MSKYKFYANYLSFVAKKTTPTTDEIKDMMQELYYIAEILEVGSTFTVKKNKLRLTARAFAGLAGFLQQHILPEITETRNPIGEIQIRWVIDTSMDLMSNLIVHAELTGDADDFIVVLPKPPLIAK